MLLWTGILYAIDAKFSILIKITANGRPLSSGGPDIELEADVVEGPVSTVEIDQQSGNHLD